jgi:hypothetical protein
MAWMTAEAAVAIAAGIIVSSIALVGFGLDSVIEFAAAAVVVWQLRGGSGGPRDQGGPAHRRHLLRPRRLSRRAEHPRPRHAGPGRQSVPGLAVTSAALVIMPSLPIAKHRTGRPWATAH